MVQPKPAEPEAPPFPGSGYLIPRRLCQTFILFLFCTPTVESAACSNTNGLLENSGVQVCQCGTGFNFCSSSTGYFCRASTNQCSKSTVFPCTNTDGTQVNTEECSCGAQNPINCAPGMFCGEETYSSSGHGIIQIKGKCRTIPACKITNGTMTNIDNCRCGNFEVDTYSAQSVGQTCDATTGMVCHSALPGIINDGKNGQNQYIQRTNPYCDSLTTCSNKDGNVANSQDCLCGHSICSAGKFCGESVSRFGPNPYYSICRNISSCQITNGTVANTNSCQCGGFVVSPTTDSSRETCTESTGLHCYSSVVPSFFMVWTKVLRCGPAPCSITDGSQRNTNDGCVCGSSLCSASTGRFCLKLFDKCADRPPCDNSDATAINPTDCTCGRTSCTALSGRACNAASSSCFKGVGLETIYVRVTSGACNDHDHTEKIDENTTCIAAAGVLGLSGNNALENLNTLYYFPPGCVVPSGSVKFNSAPAITQCSTSFPCVCQLRVPTCPYENGITSNLFPCRCGSTPCQPTNGLVCTSVLGECKFSPLCTHTAGLQPNEDVCKCGSTKEKECTPSSGLICQTTYNVGTCSRSPTCTHTNGTTPNNGTCSCGPFVDCMARSGLYCDIEKRECGCPPGQVKDQLTETCRACLPGRSAASPMAMTSCAVCPEGKYMGTSGATSCLDCEDGEHSATLGATACHVCEVGHEHVDAFTACTICLGGAFQPSNSTNHVKCALCPSGYYNADQGTVRFGEKHAGCDRCPDGLISTHGSKYCVGCPIGWSTTFNLTTPCLSCPQGWFGLTSNATVCEKCPTGFSQNDQSQASCTKCSPGEYNDVAGAATCKVCRKNSFSNDKNRSVPCNECGTGRTSERGSIKCSDCAPGKFKNLINNKQVCSECPTGFAQSETDQTNCTQCGKGEEAPIGGSSFCAVCGLGRFNLIGGKDCLECPPGRYQNDKGQSDCLNCAVDTYLNEPGKSSMKDCTSCSTKRSTGGVLGNTNASACLCKRIEYYQHENNECRPCPIGANCATRDGMPLSDLFALPGYYRSTSKKKTSFVSCRQGYTPPINVSETQERCCPLASDTKISVCNTTDASNVDTQCLQG